MVLDETEYNEEYIRSVYYPVLVKLDEFDDSFFTKEQKTFIDDIKPEPNGRIINLRIPFIEDDN